MATSVDFSAIRGDTIEGQRATFEQMLCHLARLDTRYNGEFRRIDGSGGDGGVEAIRLLPHGGEVGYQAKYYRHGRDISWSNLDNSVQTALAMHPRLERYVIALPCDFTGTRATRGGSTDGAWGAWDKGIKRWKTWSTKRGMTVEFEAWTAFELETRLYAADAQNLLHYFFDRLVFTRAWMQRHLDRTIHDLSARYSPDEHVDTDSLRVFDLVYRRPNVVRDLRAVFESARISEPRRVADVVGEGVVPASDVRRAEATLESFLALDGALDFPTYKRWPVEAWQVQWHAATRALKDVEQAAYASIAHNEEDSWRELYRKISQHTRGPELREAQVFGGPWFQLLAVDSAQAALFVGRAGSGKSHALARGASIAWRDRAPVIHILGQHIVDDDPRLSILKRLELPDWTFHDALSALNLAAEATGTRALLVIDALNEGRGLFVWRKHLASFIAEVSRFDRITLIVSCREEYLPFVVPAESIAHTPGYPGPDGSPPKDCAPVGKFVRIEVAGFKTTEEREGALRRFMDEKGIVRPTAPVLDEVFFNPLFMSSVCRAMAAAKVSVFPRGLTGARAIFEFALRTKCAALLTRYDGTDQLYASLQGALSGLARRMVERLSDSVPINETQDILTKAFQALPLSDQPWLEVLEGADILRKDVEAAPGAPMAWSMPNEVVRFAFQRLQDNLIAEFLVQHCPDIDHAFAPGAPMEFLIERVMDPDYGDPSVRLRAQWIGTIGAVWSAVAERHRKELWDLESLFGAQGSRYYEDEFREVFRVSVRERSGTAFGNDTKSILDTLWKDSQPEKLAILLSTACVPGHTWNATFIHERLCNLSQANRASGWSQQFRGGTSELRDKISEIAKWAVEVDAGKADASVVRLAGLAFCWVLIVNDQSARDCAMKGLEHLCLGATDLFPYLLSEFRAVDEASLLDRLLTVGHGTICTDANDERIRTSAQAVANMLSASSNPRDGLTYWKTAQLILERARAGGLAPAGFEVASP